MKLVVIAFIAGACTFGSAIKLVLCRNDARQLFVELQALRHDKQGLNQEWGQLLLEQATWARHARVEEIARDSLGMVTPSGARIVEMP